MQIQNQLATKQQVPAADKPLELKKDDIVTAKVKELKPNGEAILQIRGKEVQAKFEGGQLPTGERATVQVLGEKDGVVQVKALSETSSGQAGKQQSLQTSLGITDKDSPELKQAVTTLLDKGVPLSKDAVTELRSFFDIANGTAAQKLETIDQLAAKRLEITQTNLKSVHEALHSKNLGATLQEISKLLRSAIPTEAGSHAAFRQLAAELDRTGDVNKIVEQLKAQMSKLDPAVAEKIQKVIAEIQQLQQMGKDALARQWLQQSLHSLAENPMIEDIFQEVLSKLPTLSEEKPANALQDTINQIRKEANLSEAINLAKSFIQSSSLSEKMDPALQRIQQFQEAGRELKARQELANLVDEIANEPPAQKAPNAADSWNFVANGEMQTSIQLSTKDFIVREVSQKLAEMTTIFREIKRDVTKNLDNIQRLLEQFQNSARPQARQILENTIKQLDNAILKSDAMLYADMKTEKQLLLSSGQLADAKKLLAKGDHEGAAKIVQEVKAVLEKMNFQPAEIKVKRFIAQELQMREGATPQASKVLDELLSRQALRQEPTARQMFEMIRSIGLNHESEIAKSLLLQQGQQQTDNQQQNLKAMLLQMMREGMDQGRAEHALSNLNGQQLLSKADTSGNFQSMLLNIPFQLEDQTKDLQVFVKSRNQGEQVDWENCNLYFLIETKKLGEVGIMVSTNDRSLSITIRNDNDLKQTMTPLADITKEKLKELGYNVNNISYAKMKQEKAEENRKSETTIVPPTFNGKGMDFKI